MCANGKKGPNGQSTGPLKTQLRNEGIAISKNFDRSGNWKTAVHWPTI